MHVKDAFTCIESNKKGLGLDLALWQYSGGDQYNNCAKCGTSMKIARDGQFDALKKVGCGYKLKNGPLCYF